MTIITRTVAKRHNRYIIKQQYSYIFNHSCHYGRAPLMQDVVDDQCHTVELIVDWHHYFQPTKQVNIHATKMGTVT